MLIKQYDYYPVYYYSLEDLISYGHEDYDGSLTKLFEYWNSIAKDEEGDYFLTTDGMASKYSVAVTNFVTSYLIPKCATTYVDILDEGDEMTDYDYRLFMRRLGLFMNKTAERYGYLIDTFEAKKDHLMDAVKTVTESESQGIDTPQDINIPSTASADAKNHISSLAGAKTKTESDYGTLMSRLVEIRQNLENIYTLWLNDFVREFAIITGGD